MAVKKVVLLAAKAPCAKGTPGDCIILATANLLCTAAVWQLLEWQMCSCLCSNLNVGLGIPPGHVSHFWLLAMSFSDFVSFSSSLKMMTYI